jgi:hypothetical protein
MRALNARLCYRRSAEAAALLERRGRLHAVRGVLSGVAFGLLIWHLARQV